MPLGNSNSSRSTRMSNAFRYPDVYRPIFVYVSRLFIAIFCTSLDICFCFKTSLTSLLFTNEFLLSQIKIFNGPPPLWVFFSLRLRQLRKKETKLKDNISQFSVLVFFRCMYFLCGNYTFIEFFAGKLLWVSCLKRYQLYLFR